MGSFKYEVEFWTETASMIQFFEDWLTEREWKMSPSRGYELLVASLELLRANGFPAVNEPAFDFVMERLARGGRPSSAGRRSTSSCRW
jgi:hypothetical protein